MKYIVLKAQSENSEPGFIVVSWDEDMAKVTLERSEEAKRLEAADEYNDFARLVYWDREASYFTGEPGEPAEDLDDYLIVNEAPDGGKLQRDAHVFIRFDGEGDFGWTIQPKYADEDIWTQTVLLHRHPELRRAANPARPKLKTKLLR